MNADVHIVKLREEYSGYRSFIEKNKLPDELSDEIMAHFHHSRSVGGAAQDKVLAGLCASLQVPPQPPRQTPNRTLVKQTNSDLHAPAAPSWLVSQLPRAFLKLSFSV